MKPFAILTQYLKFEWENKAKEERGDGQQSTT